MQIEYKHSHKHFELEFQMLQYHTKLWVEIEIYNIMQLQ
jgi:hypothetical protein